VRSNQHGICVDLKEGALLQWEKFVKDISHDPRIERKREREPEVDFSNIAKRYKTQNQPGQLQKYIART
jgi:hypothetical protein